MEIVVVSQIQPSDFTAGEMGKALGRTSLKLKAVNSEQLKGKRKQPLLCEDKKSEPFANAWCAAGRPGVPRCVF